MNASATQEPAVHETRLPLPGRRQGKVRDIYEIRTRDGADALLIVATDRISAFDVVMPTPIPGKGAVLTAISNFWFKKFAHLVHHHLLSTDPADIPGLTDEQRAPLAGRIMIGRRTKVIPIECIVRGYITGSGFKDYQKTGAVCGIPLPRGLVNSQKLDQPLFTPSTKAEKGHDENISFDQACSLVGAPLMNKLRDLSLKVYAAARDHAATRGIIIADTKFEFGLPLSQKGEVGRQRRPGESETPAHGASSNADPILIDEILTPDSSRFWPADRYQQGREQDSLDKQQVRNYLESLVATGQWNKTPPGPPLPDQVVAYTQQIYRKALQMLTA